MTHNINMINKYRTRSGLKAEVVCTDASGAYPVVAIITEADGRKTVERYGRDGRYGPCRYIDHYYDLVPVPEMIRRTVWLNIYPYSCSGYPTKDEADNSAARYRLACVPIEISCEVCEGLEARARSGKAKKKREHPQP